MNCTATTARSNCKKSSWVPGTALGLMGRLEETCSKNSQPPTSKDRSRTALTSLENSISSARYQHESTYISRAFVLLSWGMHEVENFMDTYVGGGNF